MYVRVTVGPTGILSTRGPWCGGATSSVTRCRGQPTSVSPFGGSVASDRIYADVRCCNSDLMTSQEPQSAVIHGYSATSGETVTVQMLTGKTWTTKVASDGTWSISLDPQPASTGATIKVRCVCLRIHIPRPRPRHLSFIHSRAALDGIAFPCSPQHLSNQTHAVRWGYI